MPVEPPTIHRRAYQRQVVEVVLTDPAAAYKASDLGAALIAQVYGPGSTVKALMKVRSIRAWAYGTGSPKIVMGIMDFVRGHLLEVKEDVGLIDRPAKVGLTWPQVHRELVLDSAEATLLVEVSVSDSTRTVIQFEVLFLPRY